jgi:transposase InsO family protein
MHFTTYFSAESTRQKVIDACRRGLNVRQVSREVGVSRPMVQRWAHREGVTARSSCPHHQPRKTPAPIEEQVRAMRLATRYGPLRIGQLLHLPPSTVYRILKRLGINKLAPKGSLPPIRRYEHDQPGALLHVDVKKLHRLGLTKPPWVRDCLHVVLDDHSRVVYAELLPDETAPTAADCLERAVAWFESLGVRSLRVLTDNHPTYRSNLWRDRCQLLGLSHLRTLPRRPQTNGKVERWNRTLLEEVIHGRTFASREARTAAVLNYIPEYNTRRPHTALGGSTPLLRLLKGVTQV